jgi:hypothetical protein
MKWRACRVFVSPWFVIIGIVALSPVAVFAQRGRGAAPPARGQASAGEDLTGYWVSLVTEDWRWRMMTPPKGDYPSIPLNAEGRRIADAWDPAKETAEEKCKAYGAGNIMRVPERLHITWENENTLKVETDAGQQTRRFVFGPRTASGATATASDAGLQGMSVATWEYAGGRGPRAGSAVPPAQLKVVTAGMRPGYLQRNGVPYGTGAVITEYFSRLAEPDGNTYLIVTTIVEDPQYLNARFARSSHFKRESDGSKWKPSACE